MRDPDLMQRADRAAIALEQAWERWRAMHGLGAEPLPPVSSYVGYSLEEPWGQPRVVFGLRADEAELLASLLEGHDCVGSVYSGVGARLDWRLPAGGQAPTASRYGGPLGVPAQAPPPGIDLLPPGPPDGFAAGRLASDDAVADDEQDDDSEQRQASAGAAGAGSTRGRTGRDTRPARAGRRAPEEVADSAEEIPDRDETDWSALDGELDPGDFSSGADGSAPDGRESSPLEPLPDAPDLSSPEDEAAGSEPAAGPQRATGAAKRPVRGPGYRGPRYQGFPPRYDTGAITGQSAGGRAASPDEDDDDLGTESASGRKSHVARLSRSTRRRTQGGD